MAKYIVKITPLGPISLKANDTIRTVEKMEFDDLSEVCNYISGYLRSFYIVNSVICTVDVFRKTKGRNPTHIGIIDYDGKHSPVYRNDAPLWA